MYFSSLFWSLNENIILYCIIIQLCCMITQLCCMIHWKNTVLSKFHFSGGSNSSWLHRWTKVQCDWFPCRVLLLGCPCLCHVSQHLRSVQNSLQRSQQLRYNLRLVLPLSGCSLTVRSFWEYRTPSKFTVYTLHPYFNLPCSVQRKEYWRKWGSRFFFKDIICLVGY